MYYGNYPRHKLYAQRLLQLSGHKPDLKWLHEQTSISAKGNFYWGEESLELRNNAIANTLMAYKIIESENPHSNDLRRIRNYFLEKRGKSWRNTYESSLILETILPAILAEGLPGTRPTLVLSGTEQHVVNTFPFEYTLSAEKNNFYVSKTGEEPVYFTAYQELWDPAPQAVEKEFTVKTAFEDSVDTLDAGKPVDLLVTVEVHGRAEYLIIEVPIAAGCSYAAKPQSTLNGEVHREYYHHKVNIYCEVLEKGVYTYRIPLLPRFTGSYTLNPAVASCMYFPTLNGREGLKQVRIE